MWDPVQYEQYADLRGRPFFELLGRVRAARPARVVDLGCGPGGLTAALARRWPEADVEGIDGSAEMIDAARALAVAPAAARTGPEPRAAPGRAGSPAAGDTPEHPAPPGRLRFTVGDLTTWTPARPVDVIISNAALQWVPGHEELLPRWVDALAGGGWLAFQVPGNFDAPSHTALREVCRAPRWRDRLDGLVRARPVRDPADYLDLLAPLGCAVDAWETTYLQVLEGADPVLGWVKGTALRPVLTALGEADAADFLRAYGARLRAAYPRRDHGTVFPFRRIFVVAHKAG